MTGEWKCIACLEPIGLNPWSDAFCRDCGVIRGEAPPIEQCREHCAFWKYPDEMITAALRAIWDFVWDGTPPDNRQIFFADRKPAPPFAGNRGNAFKVAKSIDLLAFAGEYTTLRKAGPGKYKGNCPVHPFAEKSGSFYIFTDKQTWRCFGACAAGGDIVSLAGRLMDLGMKV